MNETVSALLPLPDVKRATLSVQVRKKVLRVDRRNSAWSEFLELPVIVRVYVSLPSRRRPQRPACREMI